MTLSNNRLSGRIPPQLGSLSDLKTLTLANNQLTGEIPPELENLSKLDTLTLSGNRLTGCMPESLRSAKYNDFSELDLPYCNTSPTQESHSDRRALVALYEAANGANWVSNTNWLRDSPLREWYGVITNRLGQVISLHLDNNGLEGDIPPELGNLSNLRDLNLSYSILTGDIPPELGSLSDLRLLRLNVNSLTGDFPPELANLSNLEGLNLGGNALTGCIPAALRDIESNDLSSLNLPSCP